jgi:hypothetical protein
VIGHEPDDRAAGGTGAGQRCCSLIIESVPSSVLRLRGQCRWLQSSLRWAPAGAGGMGRIRVRGGQAGSIKAAPAPPRRRGRQNGDLAPGRWPGGFHATGTGDGPAAGGCARQRIWPSRRP